MLSTLTHDRMISNYVARARDKPTDFADGLTAFAAMWALAALFSVAGDEWSLRGDRGLLFAVPAWAIVVQSIGLIARPRSTTLLLSLAITAVVLYALRTPVASNNQTIATVMNFAILLSAGYLFASSGFKGVDRVAFYEQIRIVARALLAIMYFYGIFHKINTDFLDPTVSCAVGLYVPLTRPFGLDENLFGRYVAIYATFVIEAIAIVALYWRRYFAVGFVLALVFHYIIPISAYSWYMDFSALVFALYVLSMPRSVSAMAQHNISWLLAPTQTRIYSLGAVFVGALLLALTVTFVLTVGNFYPERAFSMARHSVGILMWTIVGGGLMIVFTKAALHYLPYEGVAPNRQPRWLFVIPAVFFLSCLSPYIGLKTESSINMFSNLHTEGGQTNHLFFAKPPYLFGYQNDIVRVVDTSDPHLRETVKDGQHHVLFALKDYLRRNPDHWVSYEHDGGYFERVTASDFAGQMPGLIERSLLPFNLADFSRPKVCTH